MTCQREGSPGDEGEEGMRTGHPGSGSGAPASPILTLEPLLEGVRSGIEAAGWTLSGLQKTTSHEFEGRWAGTDTRSAYLFFHRDDLPESISVEAFLDETSPGLKGNVTLVVDGPRYGDLGRASPILERVAAAVAETVPPGDGPPAPLSLRLLLPDPATPALAAQVQLRIRRPLPARTVERGVCCVEGWAAGTVALWEELLERPEVAEFLPPVTE